MPSLRHRLGALVYDWPRFLRHIGGDWTLLRNRAESITSDGHGVRCNWEFSSNLHIAGVYPFTGRMLMTRALRDWPISFRDDAPTFDAPRVTFAIGHRGMARLPNLLATLRTIAAQRDESFECIVVEQSTQREVEAFLPKWVRYVHAPVPADMLYCRSATFNVAVRLARGEVLIAHDNDMLVPERYAAEVMQRVREGWRFIDLKRFIFYVTEGATKRIYDGAPLAGSALETVVQNLRGGSTAMTVEAYRAIGGFDEEFIGWGGEDLEFWERAAAHGGVYDFGYLPFVHVWHAAQPRKADQKAPPMQRYSMLRSIAAAERIARLRAVNFSNEK
jgi:GT2 family glycosyltransferase